MCHFLNRLPPLDLAEKKLAEISEMLPEDGARAFRWSYEEMVDATNNMRHLLNKLPQQVELVEKKLAQTSEMLPKA